MSGVESSWAFIILFIGMGTIVFAEIIRLLGWEWWRTQVERLLRRKDEGRPDDDDEDPRSGFGGLAG